ncbi:TerD family protein, partial [Streptomyces sp. A73]|nr:TerD family protein [Streptomyces sp. A73]
GPDGEETGEVSTRVNPGCDPGPVHVHGLTAERLSGAPTFDQVAGRIGAMLQNRVLVAHNAQFDYDFLAHEFARARLWLPVAQRLCTLALNRQVDPPTEDMKLGTLAAHYGVKQTRAHDALDDTRVLAGILRASLRQAARLELPLPLVPCPPRQDPQFTPQPPKAPCAFRNPGRLAPGGPLVQGMKIAVTGPTAIPRAELTARAVTAGLNVMKSVSKHTSALVANEPTSQSAKARRAEAEGVPVIDEHAFVRLLEAVEPGTTHEAPPATAAEREADAVLVAPPASTPASEPMPVPGPATSGKAGTPVVPVTVPSAPVPAPRRPEHRETAVAGRPLGQRRVLVLGGTHPEAVSARARVVELGGSAAVNLSASVTDVVLLPGGVSDRRMRRITALELPVHDERWLTAPPATVRTATAQEAITGTATLRRRAPHVLPRGGVVDLPATHGRPATHWHITATWAPQPEAEIDVVAFVLDEDEQVTFDEDFVFYGAPESPAGTVRLLSDGPAEQTVALDLASLPPASRKVVVAAAIDGDPTFGTVGPVQIAAAPGRGSTPLARATLDGATTERALLLAEFYRRGHIWRFRAVGQGYDHGLEGLARGYGVEVVG